MEQAILELTKPVAIAEPWAVLTLTQPWASLLFVPDATKRKTIETRSWQLPARYLGKRLYIHAGAGLGPAGGKREFKALIESWPFNEALATMGLQTPADFVYGAIVGSVMIDRCFQFNQSTTKDLNVYDRAFGDFRAGRFGFVTSDPVVLPTPIPCRGNLSIWKYTHEVMA